MTKKFCISISDWVFQEYLGNIRSNRSKFIEEMMVKGIQQETGEFEVTKGKLTALIQELRNKDEEIKKLNFVVGSLKKKLGSDDEERKELEKLAAGIKANNPLRDMP
jgi:septal ring factor EnvC (AmiA/AmiB activator)